MFEAFSIADDTNQKRLKKAFPTFFGEYRDPYIATGVAVTKGDHSVGIHPQAYSFELHRDLLEDSDSREWERKEFQKMYREISDEECFVTFDDENTDDPGLFKKQREANERATQENNTFSKATKAIKHIPETLAVLERISNEINDPETSSEIDYFTQVELEKVITQLKSL